METSNPLQRTAEWFSDRTGCLTASRFAAVLKRKRDGTPTQAYFDLLDTVVAERITGNCIGIGDAPALAWGRDHEDEARERYEVETGEVVDLVGFIPHPEIKWLGASPDGLVDDDGLLEIKCPFSTVVHLKRIRAGVPPPEYVPQMLMQCICTGRSWVDFVDYDPRLIGTPYEHLAFWTVRYTPTEEEKAAAIEAAKTFLADVDQAMKDLLQ
jgi:exodeoxyribonuclease (lambda-induced)